MKYITLSQRHIELARGENKQPSIDKFKTIGIEAPYLGWENDVIGVSFPEDIVMEFVGNKVNRGKTKPSKKSNKWQYKTPQWLDLRDRIIARDRGRCVSCGKESDKLHVHHLLYEKGKKMWEVPDYYLVSLCPGCHKKEHKRKLIPPPPIK